ncbi:hypothetical protein B0H13DRAFT_1922511 [Mycena leptocephala]|nr:hypothetical protein B0H13DRAFT_1922511 [Mycena leptocephala]
MGPKRKLTLAEQLEELRAQVQRQDAELKKKNQELGMSRRNARHSIGIHRVLTLCRQRKSARRNPPSQSLFLALKVSWQVKNGYNLQAEMQLSGDRSGFNDYRQQDKPKLETTIKLIQHEFKYFQRFQGAWPIKALIKQYLQNCQDKRKRDVRLERDAESNDSDGWARSGDKDEDELHNDSGEWVGGDEMRERMPTSGVVLSMTNGQFLLAKFADQSDWEDLPVGRKARSRNKENNEPEGVLEHKLNTEQRGKKRRETAATKKVVDVSGLNTAANGRQRKLTTTNPPSPSKSTASKRKPLQAPVSFPSATKNSNPNQFSEINRKRTTVEPIPDNLPRICPENIARIPFHLTQNGKNTAGYREVTNQICKHIKLENFSALAQARGWPTSVDFDGIPERVLAMENDIIGLACNSDELGGNPIWLAFLNIPGLIPDAMQRSNLCGYFGQKGKQIITELVEEVLSRNTGLDQVLHTVASLVDTPRHWDETDDDSALMSEADFVDHVLVPYFTIDFASAMKVLEDSDAFGKAVNLVTPGTDSSKHSTAMQSEAPAAKKRKVEPFSPIGTAVKPVKLTLQNFPPPVIKKTKSAVEKQPKNEPCGSAPTKVYSTRSKNIKE